MILRAPFVAATSTEGEQLPPDPLGQSSPAPGLSAVVAAVDTRLCRRFQACDLQTRAAMIAISNALRACGLNEDDLSSIELVLAEALNNIVEHAYDAVEGWIELTVELGSRGALCQIRDQGRPMPGNRPPDPSIPHIEPPDFLPEGGFGWHIIRCLTTDLRYRRSEDWNTLSFVVPLSEPD